MIKLLDVFKNYFVGFNINIIINNNNNNKNNIQHPKRCLISASPNIKAESAEEPKTLFNFCIVNVSLLKQKWNFFFLWGIWDFTTRMTADDVIKRRQAEWHHQFSFIKFCSHLHLRNSAQSSKISARNIVSISINHRDPKHALTCLVGLTFLGTEGSGSAPKFRNSESPLGGSEAGSRPRVLRDSRFQFRANFWTCLSNVDTNVVRWNQTLVASSKPIRGLSPAPTSPNLSKHQSSCVVVEEIWTMLTFNPECC